MNLNDALDLLAERLNLDVDALITDAAADDLGGRGAGFSAWAIDADEGKLLYALTRALKPITVLEVGTNEGASAIHLLAALKDNAVHDKIDGQLISFDTNAEAGGLINPFLRDRWTFRNEDTATAELPPAEFVFEDGDHSFAGATATLERVKALKPRIVISHDYAMTTAHGDFHVKEAFDALFPEAFGIVLDGCERGLGVWVNPEWTPAEAEPEPVEAPVKKATAPRKPAPKRAARK